MNTPSRLVLSSALPLVLACASTAGSGGSPYVADCPVVGSAQGYPVVAAVSGTSPVDATWLRTVARFAAYRWAVPTRDPGMREQWRNVRVRRLPPEPRWSEDWRPSARHRAVVAVTLYRDGRTGPPEVQRESGDAVFDESLLSIFYDPMPAPAFPPPPAADSVRLLLTFGEEPASPTSALVRFAAQQSPVVIRFAERRRVPFPVPRRLAVKFDVDTTGALIPDSFELLQGPGGPEARSTERELDRARIIPAESNCRPVALTVIREF